MTEPDRLRRGDSFFGIHYDFHCQARDRDLGRRVTPAMVREVIARLRPDYIQIDCKGHPGVTSYPSRFGSQPVNFLRDPLRTWRRETARAGVALYMHYSGVWDSAAVKRHPSWAAVTAEGKRSDRATSVFGPYVDELMIPQLLELARGYGVDGVWVDGDCWATVPDYSDRALAAWRKATGRRSAPKSPKDASWAEFSDFCRSAFRRYLAHYVDTLHRDAPGFQVASNWAYSSHMPEEPGTNVDFLSGDFWPHDSVNSARFEGRILANQGRPWDLMSWGFATRSSDHFRNRTPKTSVQLQQEAALVLALGGGYQCYFTQKRDASISRHDLDIYEPVAAFCRARQPWCQGTASASEIAVLYSTSAFYRAAPNLFSPWGGVADAYRGVLTALVEAGLAVDAIHDGHGLRDLSAYRLVVVPEWTDVAPAVRRALVRFAREGGAVLIVGVRAARAFEGSLGVKIGGEDEEESRRYWAFGDGAGEGELAGLWGRFATVRGAKRGVRLLGRFHTEHDHGGAFTPAASVRRIGRGRIAALYAPVGARYLDGRSVATRHGLKSLVDRLVPDPRVELLTPAAVDLTLRRRGKTWLIHLCNTAGPHASDFSWDFVPPTGPLEIRLRVRADPRAVRWQPDGARLRWRRKGAYVHIRTPSAGIHGVVAVEG